MQRFGWIAVLAALALAVLIAFASYQAGVAQGIAQSGKMVIAPAPYPYYGWHPFFPGFVFVPFVIVALVAVVSRAAHRGHCRDQRLEEWHRQAHERMS